MVEHPNGQIQDLMERLGGLVTQETCAQHPKQIIHLDLCMHVLTSIQV